MANETRRQNESENLTIFSFIVVSSIKFRPERLDGLPLRGIVASSPGRDAGPSRATRALCLQSLPLQNLSESSMPRRARWKSQPHAEPLSTVMRDSFVPKPYVRRSPIVPPPQLDMYGQGDHKLCTTYADHFPRSFSDARRQLLAQDETYPWKELALGARVPRSTSQEAFPTRGRIHQHPNLKPHPRWQPAPHAIPMSTTSSSTFVDHSVGPRGPIAPNDLGVFNTRPIRTPRATTADTFCNWGAQQRMLPVLPRTGEAAQIVFNNGKRAEYSSTHSTAFMPPPAIAYLQMVRPDSG